MSKQEWNKMTKCLDGKVIVYNVLNGHIKFPSDRKDTEYNNHLHLDSTILCGALEEERTLIGIELNCTTNIQVQLTDPSLGNSQFEIMIVYFI